MTPSSHLILLQPPPSPPPPPPSPPSRRLFIATCTSHLMSLQRQRASSSLPPIEQRKVNVQTHKVSTKTTKSLWQKMKVSKLTKHLSS
eukprot:808364-Rhodomonas_salina.2